MIGSIFRRQVIESSSDVGVDTDIQQVAILDSHAGAKGNNKPGRFDEFEELMAAEEAGGAGGRKRGGKVGNDMGDVGF